MHTCKHTHFSSDDWILKSVQSFLGECWKERWNWLVLLYPRHLNLSNSVISYISQNDKTLRTCLDMHFTLIKGEIHSVRKKSQWKIDKSYTEQVNIRPLLPVTIQYWFKNLLLLFGSEGLEMKPHISMTIINLKKNILYVYIWPVIFRHQDNATKQ